MAPAASKNKKKSNNTKSPPTPVGLFLDSRERFQIGPEIGSGVQGTVHAVLQKDDNDNYVESEYCCKVAAVPAASGRNKKTQEAHAAALTKEKLLYQIHLKQMAGDLLCNFPRVGVQKAPPSYLANHHGFRILVLERLAGPLTGVSPGAVAGRVLEALQTIHSRGWLLVDVKRDNLMMRRNATGTAAANDVVLVDLGLAVQFCGATTGKHRPNEPDQELVGTPTYSSRNVHAGDTYSRRDDVEALVLVVAEMVIQAANGNATALPWVSEKSEEALGRVKREQIEDSRSEFYQSMPAAAAKILYACLEQTAALEYAQEPDYEGLAKRLKALPKAAGATKKAAKRKSNARVEAPPAAASKRRSKREKQSASSVSEKDDMQDVVAIDDDEVEDVEMEDAENITPVSSPSQPARGGLLFVFERGPKEGQSFELVSSQPSIVLGRQPEDQGIAIPDDDQLDDTHLTLKLVDTSKNKNGIVEPAVMVYARKTKSGTLLEGKPIAKSRKARVGQRIAFGQSVLFVASLPDTKPSAAKAAPSMKAAPPSISKETPPSISNPAPIASVTPGMDITVVGSGSTLSLRKHGEVLFVVRNRDDRIILTATSVRDYLVKLELYALKGSLEVKVTKSKNPSKVLLERDVVETKARAFPKYQLEVDGTIIKFAKQNM